MRTPFPEGSGRGVFLFTAQAVPGEVFAGGAAGSLTVYGRKVRIMKYLLTGTEMAEADRATSEIIGIPSIVLMERAALAVAQEITGRFPENTKVTIVSGPGNNGADGLAAGRLLTDRGYKVQFLLLSPKDPPENSSMMIQRRILDAYGEKPEVFEEEKMRVFAPAVIVDALFGTGLGRPLSGKAAEIAQAVNAYRDETGCTVVGLDLPSGISSEDGSVMGAAVRCDLTVTFAYYKRGHFLYPGCSYCGETVLHQIGIHDRSFVCGGGEMPGMIMAERSDIRQMLAARDPGGNKGTFGKILIVAGSCAMCGAALLSAEACMRAGAGMVKIFTREENRVIIQEKLPEAMLTVYSALPEDPAQRERASLGISQKLMKDIAWADAVAIGPAIGRGEEGQILVKTLLEEVAREEENKEGTRRRPAGIVIDADALRIIAQDRELDALMQKRRRDTACILTPHLAEFADLVHVRVKEAAADRIALMRALCGRYGCTVTGKDARTLIVSDGEKQICMISNGNSGMATAGSGDVLTGITAAMLLAVKPGRDAAHNAAVAAAWIHAETGDACRESLGERAMLAGDMVRAESAVFEKLSR